MTSLSHWCVLRDQPSGPPEPAASRPVDDQARAEYLERQTRILRPFARRRFTPRGRTRLVNPRVAGATMRGGREKPLTRAFRNSRFDNANRYRRRRALVLDHIRSELPAGDLVIVAHSLGSVVAADLLPRLGEEHQVRCLLTIGSPLAARGTWTGTISLLQPQFPYDRVDAWVNFSPPTDIVTALRGLHRSELPVVDLVTRRPARLRKSHKIGPYVTDPVFVDVLDRALSGEL